MKIFTVISPRVLVSVWVLLMALLPAGALAQEDDAGQEAVWIDVRSAREYRAGHIEGAINIPHTEIGHLIGDHVSDLFLPVHLYDGNGGTFAGLALEILMEMGFQYVVNEGSYEAVLARQNTQ